MGRVLRGFVCLSAAVILSALAWSRTEYFPTPSTARPASDAAPEPSAATVAARLDEALRRTWRANSLPPAPRADDLALARRASLAIVGAIPSLEEIRWFEAQPAPGRLAAYIDRLLADRRFADVLAEEWTAEWLPDDLATYVVTDRRLRLRYWLADQFHGGRPYDEIVRDLLSGNGLWTNAPAVNFITAHEADPVQLAGRTARAFLGLRLDCAECHNHPFAPWKQSDFRGLAAFFARTTFSLKGVSDDGPVYRFDADRDDGGVVALPCVPYDPPEEWASDSLRGRLAEWTTSSENERFGRAAANRVWKKMFGRGVVEPVDDLDGEASVEGVLELLGEDFRANGFDLRRLYRVIGAAEAFSLASDLDQDACEEQTAVFAAYPAARLSAGEVARSLIQISSLRTVGEDAGALSRVKAFFDRQDFVKYFQTAVQDDAGTVAQRLMLMNGAMVAERIRADGFHAAGRVGSLSSCDRARVETAFLACLARRPTERESDYFAARLADAGKARRGQTMEDMFWTLVNCTDFQYRR